jgi:signal transduction histidine kinase
LTIDEQSGRAAISASDGRQPSRDPVSSLDPIKSSDSLSQRTAQHNLDGMPSADRFRRIAAIQIGVISIAFLLLFVTVLKSRRHRDRLIERHRAEMRRLRLQAVAANDTSRAKSEFLANMSHELRTPLNAILGFTETMRLEKFGPIGTPRYTTYLDDILMSGRHLLCIIDDVLDMSRVEAGKLRLELEQVPLGEIIDDSLRIIENTKDGEASTVSMRIDDPSTLLFVDGRRMKQVLLNVLANAKAFTPPTGRIEITAGRSSTGGLELTVSDTGIGMDPESLQTALTPFGHIGEAYTQPANGTGLGLPLAQSLVDMHGGNLTITSRLGQGTRVTIDLPRNCIADHTVPWLRVGAA